MAKTEIKIDVNCELHVDSRTASTCLHLVQIYMNANPDMGLQQKRRKNGEIELLYVPAQKQEGECVHGAVRMLEDLDRE